MAESHGDTKGQKTGAHTGADGGHGGGFPPFDSSTFPSQLVSLAVAFVVLYIIVSRFAVPRVGGIIEARHNAIEGNLSEAQKLKDESDAALKAYEGELAAARSRAQAIGNETREKLNASAEAERKALEAKLAGKLADAEKQIAATRTAAMRNVKSIAADAAGNTYVTDQFRSVVSKFSPAGALIATFGKRGSEPVNKSPWRTGLNGRGSISAPAFAAIISAAAFACCVARPPCLIGKLVMSPAA